MLENFKQMIARENFVVLDTETTALQRGEICQLAIIDPQGKVLLDTLVKPTRPIPADATRIHGITDADVATAPSWGEIVSLVQTLIADKDVVVYNAQFDRYMFHSSADIAGLAKIDWKTVARWHCAMEAYAEYYGDWNDYRQSYRWQRLTHAARQCRIEVSKAHTALGDCYMTLGVVRAMVGAVK